MKKRGVQAKNDKSNTRGENKTGGGRGRGCEWGKKKTEIQWACVLRAGYVFASVNKGGKDIGKVNSDKTNQNTWIMWMPSPQGSNGPQNKDT